MQSIKETWNENDLICAKQATDLNVPLSQPSQQIVSADNFETYWNCMLFEDCNSLQKIMVREESVRLEDYATRYWEDAHQHHLKQYG